MTSSLEGWPTKAKEAPSPQEVRLAPLGFQPPSFLRHPSLNPTWLFENFVSPPLFSIPHPFFSIPPSHFHQFPPPSRRQPFLPSQEKRYGRYTFLSILWVCLFYFRSLKAIKWTSLNEVQIKYKQRKKIKRYFVYTSVILHSHFLKFVEMNYTSVYLSLQRNKLIQETYFKYTSEFEKK